MYGESGRRVRRGEASGEVPGLVCRGVSYELEVLEEEGREASVCKNALAHGSGECLGYVILLAASYG